MKPKLVVGFLILLFFILFFHAAQPERNDVVSTYNTDVSGVKALYLLLDRLGFSVSRFSHYYDRLPPHDTLLVVLSPEYSVSREEAQNLLEWVKEGGSVLWGTNRQDLFGTLLHLEIADSGPPATKIGVDDLSVAFDGKGRIEGSLSSENRILLRDHAGIVMLRKQVGSGKVYFLTVSDVLTNHTLEKEDNAAFLVRLLDQEGFQKIAFDEYHHGMEEYRSFAWFLRPNMKMALTQLTIVCLLFLYWLSKRFGPIRSIPSPLRRSSLEFIRAKANLWQRAGACSLALRFLMESFQWQVSRGGSEEEFRQLRDNYEDKIKQGISEEEFFTMAQELETIRREITVGSGENLTHDKPNGPKHQRAI